MREKHDCVIVGGGPAGLAAAVELWKRGVRDILIVEREKQLGGILRQCIHDGFGLTRFKTSLSGPEYAERFTGEVRKYGIPYVTDTTVLSVTAEKKVTLASPRGMRILDAGAVVLAMGCRERTRGALAIPGERPAGVFTAGVAQAYVNLYNKMVGRNVVILGSGDIGMIMARRLTLEGAHVKAVFEIQGTPSGLARNIHQCLDDYGIPLYLSHTVTDIHGSSRLTGVTVSEVDENLRPIEGTETEWSCDTLILSVGLIPETELNRDAGVPLDERTRGAIVDEFFQTRRKGFFSAGNVLHVHDLVDFVSLEAEKMAAGVEEYLRFGSLPDCPLRVLCAPTVASVVPQRVSGERDVLLSLRVKRPWRDCEVRVTQEGRVLAGKAMKRAVPAEMISLSVAKETLSGKGDLEVEIQC